MKKLFISLIVSFGFVAFLPVTAMAAPAPALPGTTYIAGTITQSSNKTPVSGATVVVTCDSNTANSSTTVAGGYLVTFTNAQCPNSSTAGVAASKGSLGGSNSGTVNTLTSTPTVINLALVNVSLVPELGLITGAGAVVLGGGAFLVIRRRNLSANQS